MTVPLTGPATGPMTGVRLQPLTYVHEGDEVLVGRPDTGSYGVFPPEGADLLRSLEAGATLESAARQWHERTGQTLDMADFLGIIEDLGFVVGEDDVRAEPPQIRWQRLARAVFSPAAWLVYAAAVAGGLTAMVLDRDVRPGYGNIFFTSHIAFIPVALALSQIPLLLLHEAFHALAARRLGLPSTLGIGRRFYYLVAETRLDSLYSVPRRRRYLPFLAGSLIDATGVGVFTLLAVAGRHWGAPSWLSGLALALAFSGVLRISWECLFYLQTDYYFVINTATGCSDLHGAAKHRLRGRLKAVLRKAGLRRVGLRKADLRWAAEEGEGQWSDRDLAAARWYALLMVAGYGVSLATLLLVGLPTAVRFWSIVVHRFASSHQSVGGIIDTVFFILLSLIEFGLLGYVTVRDLRRRRARTSLNNERNAS
jgi:hypothetical protein